MKHRRIALILAAILLLALLGGCGNEPTASSAEPVPASTAEEEAEAPASKPEEEITFQEEVSAEEPVEPEELVVQFPEQ